MERGIIDQHTFVCFNCMRPNEPDRKICKFCNAPISRTSSNDPLQTALGEGMVYSKAVESKPKPIIILGVWILFFPMFIMCSYLAIETLFIMNGSIGFVIFWVTLLVAAFSFLMLYRVTKNYLYFDENTGD